MDPVPVPPTSDEVVAQVQDDAVLVTPPPKHVEAQEVQPTSSDLGKLAQTGDQNPVIVLGLAILAVVGGGSAWKLWTKRSEQSHELAMKRLELDAATMNGTAQPPPCQTKQAEVEAKLAALEARIAQTEKASLAFPDVFDADELVGRLSKVEGAIKRLGVKPPTPKGGSK